VRCVLALVVAGCGFAPQAISSGDDDARVDSTTCALDCPAGCDPTGTRCLELVPSNGIDPGWLPGPAPLDATIDLVLDTDAGTIDGIASTGYHQVAAVDCGGGAIVGIGVFAFSTITIGDGVHVTAVGTRALALVSVGPIEIHGVIDASSGVGCPDPPRCAGPGGFAGGLYDAYNPQVGFGPGGGGHGYSADGPGNESGGGGGAACGSGGTGGDDGSGLYLPGLGGTAYLAAALVPLCGGSGGGAGGPASFVGDPGSRGGGGGGAVQIVSATSVTIGSTVGVAGIRVAGGGGQGDKASTIDDGGGGGGAGGAILLEAPKIEVDGVLAANGGGGGGGYNNGAVATDGESGQLSATAAAGGPGVRRGGNGGAGATIGGEIAPGPVGDGGAGGGGGAGRIRLNTRSSAATIAGTLSPSAGECATQGRIATR
jgi:hypothetical protein